MIFRFLSILVGVLIFVGCARRGKPEGGEEDMDPPIFLNAEPSHESIHFKEEKIRLNFNEYVKLKDVNNQLVISPPMKNRPIITPAGSASKTLKIRILDTLQKNTTYTLNFGNSVEDNNEGNAIINYKYVFSTGDYIDSLKIKGSIKDAIRKDTIENFSVLLYKITEAYTDSIIFKEQPTYAGKTIDSVNFEITNLKEGKYLIIALRDFTSNYRYDPRQDKIGFYSEFITLPTEDTYDISLFKEVPAFEATRPSEVKKGRIYFGYEGDPKNMKIDLLSDSIPGFKSAMVYEEGKDSVSYWYTPMERDSLVFKVSQNEYMKEFTVRLRSKELDSLMVSSEYSGTLNLKDTFSIVTNIPIDKINRRKITILDKDSLDVSYITSFDQSKMKLKFDFEVQSNQEYKFKFLPEAITDLFGNVNDTLNFNTKTKAPEDYGIISFTVKNIRNFPIIIQLLDNQDAIIESIYSENESYFRFENLETSNYWIRIIFDTNKNKKWDSGNFLNRIQPEKMIYFPEKIEVQSNWISDKTFILE
jgi:uncharacterized protein (DUF2141 family)